MGVWTIYDYVEKTGRNPVRDWLDTLPESDCAKVDYRLQQMAAMPRWPEKWVSKYQGYDDIFELRISGNKIEYRPLFAYHGEKQFIILVGAIEKGGKIPKQDLETAQKRLTKLLKDPVHARLHQYDDEENLEEDAEEGLS
jgi:phage-related protein